MIKDIYSSQLISTDLYAEGFFLKFKRQNLKKIQLFPSLLRIKKKEKQNQSPSYACKQRRLMFVHPACVLILPKQAGVRGFKRHFARLNRDAP